MPQPAPDPHAESLPPRSDLPSSTGRAFRSILVVAPAVAFVVGLARVATEPSLSVGYVAASLLIPAVLVALLILSTVRPGLRSPAAGALFLEAAAAGAFLPDGLAAAVILPVIGVGLVQSRLRSGALEALFGGAATAAVAGITLAVLVGPTPGPSGPVGTSLTIAAFTMIEIFALALVWRSTRDLSDALDQAQRQIVARGRTESELDRTAEILSAIVRSSPVATLAFGLDLKVTLWSPATERTFGWTADEVIGKPVPDGLIPDTERASWAARIERTLNGAVTNGDRVQRRTKDGRDLWVDIYAAPLRDRLSRPIGVAAQLVDVSDRVALEMQLLQAQKMETVGLLASGIAHDFNNTLAAAGGFAALIDLNAADDEVRSDAREIIKAVERARQLTGKLLAFGRRSESSVRSIDARSVVIGLQPLIRQLIGPETEIDLELADEPTVVRTDPGQLEQALINLAVNARDAMPRGGRLTLTVGQCARHEASPRGAGRVEIAVRDSGTGIPVELRQRIFEPFFTTKADGVGSGLGLAMVKGFVASANGEVTVDSVVDEGTTFTLCLPGGPTGEPRGGLRPLVQAG
jgi:PAS domain S-box-containing protein